MLVEWITEFFNLLKITRSFCSGVYVSYEGQNGYAQPIRDVSDPNSKLGPRESNRIPEQKRRLEGRGLFSIHEGGNQAKALTSANET
jgi:hypothetical protein